MQKFIEESQQAAEGHQAIPAVALGCPSQVPGYEQLPMLQGLSEGVKLFLCPPPSMRPRGLRPESTAKPTVAGPERWMGWSTLPKSTVLDAAAPGRIPLHQNPEHWLCMSSKPKYYLSMKGRCQCQYQMAVSGRGYWMGMDQTG